LLKVAAVMLISQYNERRLNPRTLTRVCIHLYYLIGDLLNYEVHPYRDFIKSLQSTATPSTHITTRDLSALTATASTGNAPSSNHITVLITPQPWNTSTFATKGLEKYPSLKDLEGRRSGARRSFRSKDMTKQQHRRLTLRWTNIVTCLWNAERVVASTSKFGSMQPPHISH